MSKPKLLIVEDDEGLAGQFGTDKGVVISELTADGPAEKAGLKGGDIIIKFGSKQIKNIYDFTAVLAEYKPGDEVVIVVKRGTEEVSLKAVMQGRQ